MVTHSRFLPGKFRGERSLVVYSPWVAKSWTQLRDGAYLHTLGSHVVSVSGVKQSDSAIHTHAYTFFSEHVHICTHTRVCSVASAVSDSVILWTAALQAPLSMEFCRQEYWSIRLPCPPSGDVPGPEVEPTSPASPALMMDSLPTEQHEKPIYIFFFWGKKATNELIYKTEKGSQTQKTNLWLSKGKEGG